MQQLTEFQLVPEQWGGQTIMLPVSAPFHSALMGPAADAMRERGPRALVVTVPGCGHAPALNVPEQLELVARFLAGGG